MLINNPTPQVVAAFEHVKTFFPTLSIVVFDAFGNWNYMDAHFESFTFNEKIDVSLLEQAADSLTVLPIAFQNISD